MVNDHQLRHAVRLVAHGLGHFSQTFSFQLMLESWMRGTKPGQPSVVFSSICIFLLQHTEAGKYEAAAMRLCAHQQHCAADAIELNQRLVHKGIQVLSVRIQLNGALK